MSNIDNAISNNERLAGVGRVPSVYFNDKFLSQFSEKKLRIIRMGNAALTPSIFSAATSTKLSSLGRQTRELTPRVLLTAISTKLPPLAGDITPTFAFSQRQPQPNSLFSVGKPGHPRRRHHPNTTHSPNDNLNQTSSSRRRIREPVPATQPHL